MQTYLKTQRNENIKPYECSFYVRIVQLSEFLYNNEKILECMYLLLQKIPAAYEVGCVTYGTGVTYIKYVRCVLKGVQYISGL